MTEEYGDSGIFALRKAFGLELYCVSSKLFEKTVETTCQSVMKSLQRNGVQNKSEGGDINRHMQPIWIEVMWVKKYLHADQWNIVFHGQV